MRTPSRLAAALFVVASLFVSTARPQAEPDPKVIQEIFECLAVGLPKDWNRAWMSVTQVAGGGAQGEFEGRFFYATSSTDVAGKPLSICGAQTIAQAISRLRADLPADKRGWKGLKLTFTSEGKFDLYYDYGK